METCKRKEFFYELIEVCMKIQHGNNFCVKDKKSVFIDPSVKIGDNVTIYENNRIEGNTVIGNGVTILPGCYIVDSIISDNSVINNSQSEK